MVLRRSVELPLLPRSVWWMHPLGGFCRAFLGECMHSPVGQWMAMFRAPIAMSFCMRLLMAQTLPTTNAIFSIMARQTQALLHPDLRDVTCPLTANGLPANHERAFLVGRARSEVLLQMVWRAVKRVVAVRASLRA